MFAGLGMSSGTKKQQLYVDDVFSTYLYTGTGAALDIVNGADLSTGVGLVWIKNRNSTEGNYLTDTVRGAGKALHSENTGAEGDNINHLSSFNVDGFSVGVGGGAVNTSGYIYGSWTFIKADRFFDVQTVVKSASSDATVDLSALNTVGMVKVKRTDSTGSWYVWHKDLTAGKLLYLEQSAAEATLGHISVSGTTLTLHDGVIADGTYVVYAYAHDPLGPSEDGSDGLIACGTITHSADEFFNIELGWEPQYVLWKRTNITSNWEIMDMMRPGFDVVSAAGAGNTDVLKPNTSDAEAGVPTYIGPNATGFGGYNDDGATTRIYMAIRRPNKPPTSGTEVFDVQEITANQKITTGFISDFMISAIDANSRYTGSRLSGGKHLLTNSTVAEGASSYMAFDYNDGVDYTAGVGSTPQANIFNFRRAPGFFDAIADTGTGANKTENHSLTTAPELWLRKGRSGATEWVWGSSLLAATEKIVMPSPNGKVTDAAAWNSTYPTASLISLGTAAAVNTSAATYITYLWATLAGISKVFAYTGDGTSDSSKVIDCGFAAGARFVLIIRTTASTAQDIFIWDTVRGIVAGDDPHLSLNTTAAEVTTDDSIDPASSGFIVNQVAATNININGAEYIGLAIA